MKKVKTIIVIILLILLLPIIIVNSVIIVNSYMNPDKIPSFCGWKPFIVLSGSMETQIKTGDLVIVKETDNENKRKQLMELIRRKMNQKSLSKCDFLQ